MNWDALLILIIDTSNWSSQLNSWFCRVNTYLSYMNKHSFKMLINYNPCSFKITKSQITIDSRTACSRFFYQKRQRTHKHTRTHHFNCIWKPLQTTEREMLAITKLVLLTHKKEEKIRQKNDRSGIVLQPCLYGLELCYLSYATRLSGNFMTTKDLYLLTPFPR